MSSDQLDELREFTENLISLQRAPSQFTIFFQLVNTGRTLTVKEMAEENQLTEKATERAVAKLVRKKLVERSPFRDGGYTVDSRRIMLSMYMLLAELYEDYTDRKG